MKSQQKLSTLDNDILRFAGGDLTPQDFFDGLLSSSVTILSTEPVDRKSVDLGSLLMFESDSGEYRLPIFSTTQRAKGFDDEFTTADTMTFEELLVHIPQDVGIVINPNEENAIEIDAAGVRRYAFARNKDGVPEQLTQFLSETSVDTKPWWKFW